MKNIFKFLGAIAIVAILGIAVAGCENTVNIDDDDLIKTPVASDYNIGNLNQTTGNVTAVTVTPKPGKSPGAVTVYYEGAGDTTYAKSIAVPGAEGTYAVTFDVAAAEGWNAANGLIAGTLTIGDGVIPENQTPVAGDYTIGGSLTRNQGDTGAITVTPKEGKSPGAVTVYYEGTGDTVYAKSATVPTAAGTYAVTFDVAAATGWNAATGLSAGTLTIHEYDPNLSTPTAADYDITGAETFTYDGSPHAVTVTAKQNKSTGAVTVLYNNVDIPSGPTNAGTYTVTFNVAKVVDAWNAAGGLSAGTLTINKATGATVDAPTAAEIGVNSVTLQAITALTPNTTGQSVEYAYSTSTTALSTGWQDGLTFNNLQKGTEYYFFARAKENENYNTGAESSGTKITTILPDLAGTVTISPNNNGGNVIDISTGSKELTATYSGTEAGISYQWQLNGSDVGTDSNKHSADEVGNYTVTVSADGFNAKTSAAVEVINSALPDLEGAVSITPDTNVFTFTALTANYTGSESVSYQWYHGGNVVGTDSNKYTPTEAGSYTVTVSASGYNPKQSGAVTVSNRTPAVGDYTIVVPAASDYNGSVRTVTVTAKGSATTPNATSSTGAVTVYYSSGNTTAPSNAGTYAVTFSVAAAEGWNTAANLTAGTLTINKVNPTVTWPTATAITYGTALSASHLTDGSASVNGAPVSGTFMWTNGATVPSAGNPSYEVTFTPADTANYHTLTYNVAITVNKANPAVTWPTAATITYGQTLANAVFTGDSGSGTFAYTNASFAPTVANSGTAYEVTFTPADTANYHTLTHNVAITVNKANPAVTWPTAATITYGVALSTSTLSGGTASVPGTFVWTTPATIPWATETTQPTLANSTHSVTFTPTDGANYNTTTGTVSIIYPTGTPGLSFDLLSGNTAYRVSRGTATGNIQIPAYWRPNASTSYDDYKPVTEISNGTNSSSSNAFGSSSASATITAVHIPATVTTIGNYAFYNRTGFTSITIPASVTTLGNYAFSGCSGLTSVTIGSGVTTLNTYTFENCTGLTNITINGIITGFTSSSTLGARFPANGLSVTFNADIGNYAFYSSSANNTKLTSVTIGSGVTTIGNYAFQNCTGLTGNLTIPNSVTSIGNYAFGGCSGLTGNLVIPNSVMSIGGNAFSGCSGLTGNLVIPNSVTSLGTSAFVNCSGLTSVTIGSGVPSIGQYTFQYCSGLTSVTIGSGVTSIGTWAFSGCTKLAGVIFQRNDTTTISSSGDLPGDLVTKSGGTGAVNRYGTYTTTNPGDSPTWVKQ